MLLDVELPGDHFGQHTGEAANRAAPGEHPVPVDDRRHRNAVVGTHVTVDRGEHVVGRDGEGKFVETVEFCDGIRGIAADGDELHLFFTQFMGEQPNLRKGGGSVLTEGPEKKDDALFPLEVGQTDRIALDPLFYFQLDWCIFHINPGIGTVAAGAAKLPTAAVQSRRTAKRRRKNFIKVSPAC